MTSKTIFIKDASWDEVQVGDIVQLVDSARTKYIGRVDARTPDGNIIWVHDPVGGRRLFHIQDGYTLGLSPS